MDPKKLSQLDPKLQEAYNKVMATPVATTTAPAGATVSVSTQTTTTQQPAAHPTTPPTTPLSPPPLPTLTPIGGSTKTSTTTVIKPGAQAAPVGMIAKNGSGGVSPVILAVAAVIFFLVYALFWVKFFNFPVPFLP